MSVKYPEGIRFECERCGRCCRDTESKLRTILLLGVEANKLSHALSRGINEFADEVEGYEPYEYLMKKTDEGKCLFLKDNSCSIYELRPLICRFYPFQLKDLGNESYIFIPTDECPGIGNGSSVEQPFYENLFNLAKRLMKRDK